MCNPAVVAIMLAQLAIAVQPCAAQLQSRAFELVGTEVHEFETKDGSIYELYVSLPIGYHADSAATYPVFYLTDGRSVFPLLAGTSYGLQWVGEIEEIILVGVDRPLRVWPDSSLRSSYMDAFVWRSWDLTPTRNVEEERSDSVLLGRPVRTGGAQQFRSVLIDEIVPWVEARFRTSGRRGLYGGSLGGLFATYVLFTEPGSFSHYLIGSPSLYYDNEVAFRLEQVYSERSAALPARVFISGGSDESNTRDMLRLVEVLSSRNYEGLELRSHVFEGETHMSVWPVTMSRGVRYLFGNR